MFFSASHNYCNNYTCEHYMRHKVQIREEKEQTISFNPLSPKMFQKLLLEKYITKTIPVFANKLVII
jgi:hypothetical protein